jgi:hypothetical protein
MVNCTCKSSSLFVNTIIFIYITTHVHRKGIIKTIKIIKLEIKNKKDKQTSRFNQLS